jgi:hypothetical protein
MGRQACREDVPGTAAAMGDILAAGGPGTETCRGWARTASRVGKSDLTGLWMDL